MIRLITSEDMPAVVDLAVAADGDDMVLFPQGVGEIVAVS